MNRRTTLKITYLCSLLALMGIAGAQADSSHSAGHAQQLWVADANDWEKLDERERGLLKPYRDRWDDYSTDERQRLRDGAQRYQRLSPKEQQALQQGRERYQRLSPDERKRLRDNYKKSKKDED